MLRVGYFTYIIIHSIMYFLSISFAKILLEMMMIKNTKSGYFNRVKNNNMIIINGWARYGAREIVPLSTLMYLLTAIIMCKINQMKIVVYLSLTINCFQWHGMALDCLHSDRFIEPNPPIQSHTAHIVHSI